MKQFITDTGVKIGCFDSIEKHDDSYFCDGVVYPFSTLGSVEIIEYCESIKQDAPITISMRQARLQLLAMNLLDAVNAQINTLSQSAQIEWEFSSEIRRDNPLVAQLQSSLAMTDNDMNQFFYEAANL